MTRSDAQHVLGTRHLGQHHGTDDRRRGREQRQEEREAGARQPRHRELVADIGDHRRADADAEPGQQQRRVVRHRLQRLDEADRHDEQERGGHRRPEPLDAAGGTAPGDPVAEHDVAHEQRTVQEGPEQARGIARPAHVDEDEHARDRQAECQRGCGGSAGRECDADRADELDRGDHAHRQPVQRQIERGVHHGEAGAQRQQQGALAGCRAGEGPPRPGPGCEDERRRGDAQPRDAEHAHRREQQHGEGRAQIVEDGAHPEPGMGRHGLGGAGEG